MKSFWLATALTLILTQGGSLAAEPLPPAQPVVDACEVHLAVSSPSLLSRVRYQFARGLAETRNYVSDLIQNRFKKQEHQNTEQSGPAANLSRAPKSYRAHNKNTDKPPGSNQENEVVARAHGMADVVYFVQSVFQSVNPRTGEIRRAPVRARSKIQFQFQEFVMEFPMTRQFSFVRGSTPLIPAGYEISNTSLIEIDATGNYEFVGSRAQNTVEVGLIRQHPRELNNEERQAYSTLDEPLRFDQLPQDVAEFIVDLQGARRSGQLSAIRAASKLIRFVQGYAEYNVKGNKEVGVEAWLQSKKYQCDGAAVIAVSLLRQFFGIHARVVSGYMGAHSVDSPQDSIVVLPTDGHAWVQIHDPITKLWVDVDATPSHMDSVKDHPDVEDPRYQMNRPDSPKDEGQNQLPTSPQEPPSRPKPSENGPPPATESFLNPRKEFDDLLMRVTSPSQFRSSLLDFRHQHQGSADHFLLEQVNTLIQALGPQPLWSWSLAVSGVFEAYDPNQPNLDSAKPFIDLRSIFRVLATSRHREALSFRNVAVQMDRFLPRQMNDPNDALSFTRNTVRSLMFRPLERTWIQQIYPNLTTDVEVAQNFLLGLNTKALEGFAVRSQLDPYIDTEFLLTPRQRRDLQTWGRPEAFGEGELNLQTMREFDRPETIHRDGLPPSLDYYRFLAGDLMEGLNQARDVQTDLPNSDSEYRSINFVLADMSGSNTRNDRERVRNALILRYFDLVALQMNESGDGSKLIFLPYTGSPGTPLVMSNLTQARTQFEKWAAVERKSEGDNNTAAALVAALDYAIGNLTGIQRINFFLITDGEETINVEKVKEALQKLPPELEVNLSATTLVTGNEEIQTLIDAFASMQKNPSSSQRPHHIDLNETERILAGERRKDLVHSQTYDWRDWKRGSEVKVPILNTVEKL